MKKIIFGLLFSFAVQFATAQKTVVMEQLRCFSTIGPVMTYWRIPEVKRTFAIDLYNVLLKYEGAVLIDTASLHIEPLTTSVGASVLKPAFTDTDTSRRHLYLDLYELDLNTYFSYAGRATLADTGIQKRAQSIFILKAWWVNSNKKILSTEELHIIATPGETIGIGNLYTVSNGYKSTPPAPKGFSGLLQKGMMILFDPKNELARVEMKVPSAYMADNFILPKTNNQPRVIASTQKGVTAYHYRNELEMIRMGEQLYEEILIKGKKIEKYPDDLTAAIRRTFHYGTSDFVFLRQECRDVVRDRNYLVKLTTQVDPEYGSANRESMFTNFLEGKFHYLLAEKDTLASFTITKRVQDFTGKKVFPFKITNGVDSTTFSISDTRQDEWPVIYNYVVTGKIGGQDFSIQCSGQTNSLKEIYLNGKLLCIADGKFSPDKFVVFDASLSPEILNQLFIIGFNRFFI